MGKENSENKLEEVINLLGNLLGNYTPAALFGPFYFENGFFSFWGVKAMRWEPEAVG